MPQFEHKIRKAMFLVMLKRKIPNAASLAEETATYFGRRDWIGDEIHPVLELAREFFPQSKLPNSQKGA